MDFRKTFDKIPEEFDKFRPRYCEELFQELAQVCGLDIAIASKNKRLYNMWKERLECIEREFSGFGWGMDDFIAGEYFSIPWVTWEE